MQIKHTMSKTAYGFNWIAAGAILIMMGLTCADVFLRLLRHPIPGTYEIVGMLGAIVISFSLAYTSLEKGHIAVEFLVQKFSRTTQTVIDILNACLGIALFSVIAWQSVLYAEDIQHSGEVSATLQMPLHPFVYGIAIGCSLLCLVLTIEALVLTRRIIAK